MLSVWYESQKFQIDFVFFVRVGGLLDLHGTHGCITRQILQIRLWQIKGKNTWKYSRKSYSSGKSMNFVIDYFHWNDGLIHINKCSGGYSTFNLVKVCSPKGEHRSIRNWTDQAKFGVLENWISEQDVALWVTFFAHYEASELNFSQISRLWNANFQKNIWFQVKVGFWLEELEHSEMSGLGNCQEGVKRGS